MREENQNWNMKYEREVSLMELAVAVLRKSKIIIISMIVFALSIGGFKYVKDMQIYKEQQLKKDEVTNIALTKDEEQTLRELGQIEKQLNEKKNYEEKSILMTVNPYEKNFVTLQYLIETNYTIDLNSVIELDDMEALRGAYVDYIDKKSVLDSIMKQLDWNEDKVYIGELLSISAAGNIFSVDITGIDEEKTAQLASAVEQELNRYQAILNEKIGEHELKLIDKFNGTKVDDALLEKQRQLQESIVNLEKNYLTLEKTLPASLKADTSQNSIEEVKISKKYIILGIIFGFLVSFIGIITIYIFSDKLRSVRELQTTYGVRIFGEIGNDEKKDAFVMRMLMKLHKRDNIETDVLNKYMTSNIVATCKRENIQNIFAVTTLSLKENERKIVNEIVDNLEARGICLTLGENIIYNAEALEKMVEIKNVLLVEKIEKTECSILEKELLMCAQQGINILGAIVLQ